MTKKSSQRKRQMSRKKKASRQRKKRKAKQTRPPVPRGRRAQLRAAAGWPLHRCLVSEDWNNPMTPAEILVSRRSPDGDVAVAAFLVDLACLGVKSAFGRIGTVPDYNDLRRSMSEHTTLVPADLNLVAKIIRTALDYAGELGFRPDPDYRDAMPVLGEANPDACREEIPVGGPDGKPFFIAGPYDNARAIVEKLVHKLGPDGFQYLIALEPDDEIL